MRRAEIVPVIAKVDALVVNDAKNDARLNDAIEKIGDMAKSLNFITDGLSKLNEVLIKLAERKGFTEKVWLFSLKVVGYCIGVVVSISSLYFAEVFKMLGKWLIS